MSNEMLKEEKRIREREEREDAMHFKMRSLYPTLTRRHHSVAHHPYETDEMHKLFNVVAQKGYSYHMTSTPLYRQMQKVGYMESRNASDNPGPNETVRME